MKERKKRSIIWTTPPDKFQQIVKNSKSIADICRYFKFGIKGGTYKVIKRRIQTDNIDISHFEKRNPAKWRYVGKKEFLSRLKENTPSMCMGSLKSKILEFSLLEYKCYECGLENMWNNKPIVLHLDHINGDRSDNRLENLRFLCPNCHTQTPTFSMGTRKRKLYFCSECNGKMEGYANRCISCGHKSRRKVSRPEREVLVNMVKTMPMTKIASHFGMSDNAVRKWCKSMGIDYKVGTGYWTKPEDAHHMHKEKW